MKPASLRPFLPHPALRRRLPPPHHRTYASTAPGPATLQVFNDHAKHLQRERSASNPQASRAVDYLRDEVATRLCERLLDIKRNFPCVLDLGANACNIARALTNPPPPPPPPNEEEEAKSPASPREEPQQQPLATRLGHLTSADTSPSLLDRDASLPFNSLLPSHERVVLPPPSRPLPFAPHTYDAILSSLNMHWINDLPTHLSQCATVLRPDSPFIAAMLGGDSLYELRTSLQLADLDRRGGVSTHVSPLADVRDMGGLLTRAGFRMLTVDVDDIVVEYPDTFALMRDLQDMGESNASLTRELAGLRREVLLANEGIYRELHGGEGREGGLPATFRVIYMIGWTEGEGQQQPEKRGTGQVNLADVLGGGGSPGEEGKR